MTKANLLYVDSSRFSGLNTVFIMFSLEKSLAIKTCMGPFYRWGTD